MGTRCWFINWKFTSSHSIQVFWLHSKNQNQKKVNNHCCYTDIICTASNTTEMLFLSSSKGLDKAAMVCLRKSHQGPLSFWLPKKALFPIQLPESASIWGLGDLAGGKPPSQEIFRLGIVAWNDEVPLFVAFVFEIRSNESFLHNGKRPDRFGKCSISGGPTLVVEFFF